MLDADLAEIYGYSTKRFNEQVKCNIERFDADFRFQLTRDEYLSILRSEKTTLEQGKYAKYLPYAFTEQGIYMLMTVLRGDLAILQSKAIIRLFKQMKDYIIEENRTLLGYDGLARIVVQTERNTKDIAVIQSDLQKVMANFIDPSTFKHFLILNGQRLEADVAYTQIYGMAKKSVLIVDDYLDFGTVSEKLFHCGASSKDAGNKITTIMQLEDIAGYRALFERLLREGEWGRTQQNHP